jgi:mRNA interferase RelE/StbE
LGWTVEVTLAAAKQIKGLGPTAAPRIRTYLRDRLSGLEDPRLLGKALTGSDLGQFWCYRVGDYRIVCDIQDAALVVLVVEVGHRREVYR